MSELKYGRKLNTFRYFKGFFFFFGFFMLEEGANFFKKNIKKIKGGHKYHFRETKIKFWDNKFINKYTLRQILKILKEW
jgi:hypothetical protein